jgi:hypothetical protein
MSNQHGDQPRHRRATMLLARAIPVAAAVVTLAAGPLAGATPAATAHSASRASTVLAGDPEDLCGFAILQGAFSSMKWPLCAGD